MHNSRTVITMALISSALVASLTVLSKAARAEDALMMELRAMATDHVLPLIQKRGGGAVAVGGFTAATSVKGSSGPEIQMKLSQILQQLDARVDADDYRFEITGNYLPYSDPDSGLNGVKLVGRMVDADDGTTLGEFPRFVFGAEAVPRMLGLNVSTRGSSDPIIQSIAFRKAIKAPSIFVVDKKRVAPTPVSEYALEILVRERGRYRPRTVQRDRKSRPFVDIRKDEVYAVRLINHSQHEAAVRLTIDGVNVFAFSEFDPQPNHWIVPPKRDGKPGETMVRGWAKDTSSLLEFKVVDFPDSAAARVRLQPSAAIGVITASFAACWEHERDRPRGEGRTRATGFGKEIAQRTQRLRRQIGQVRDVISIRYERDHRSDTVAGN